MNLRSSVAREVSVSAHFDRRQASTHSTVSCSARPSRSLARQYQTEAGQPVQALTDRQSSRHETSGPLTQSQRQLEGYRRETTAERHKGLVGCPFTPREGARQSFAGASHDSLHVRMDTLCARADNGPPFGIRRRKETRGSVVLYRWRRLCAPNISRSV